MTALIAIGGFVVLAVYFCAWKLCRAASLGDRQLRAAERDRHLRSLP